MKEVKNREVIVGNELVKTNAHHPDENIKNKFWIAELFVKEFENAFILFGDLADKDVYKISINGEIYNFNFDTTDSGGRENSRKVSIPFASRKFRESIIDGDNIYVVNLYRPLNEDLTVNTEKRIWLMVDPLEIYNSNVIEKETFNDSSRWFLTNEIKEVIEKNETLHNKKKNVYAALNEKVEELVLSNRMKSRYYLMKEMSETAKNFIDSSDDKNLISKIRGDFRKVLLNFGLNNQTNSIVRNESLLVASHIHSVDDIKKDTNLSLEEKLFQIGDPNNGLLIPVGLDKLFDRYLITFNDEWEMITSSEVDEEEIVELTGRKIQGTWIHSKGEESLKYLQKHREKAFKIREYN